MSRYYETNSTNNIRASGWQSPLPTANSTYPTSSSSATRIVVDCPFGSKKCDYTIDKSQRGRLIITARRRSTFASDYLSVNNKNNIAVQTFQIPYDADVDHLQSHIERYTNCLIIEIPRLHSRYNTYTNSIDSPDTLRDTSHLKHDDRKLDYRIDCHGYTADQLNIFIQGQDLIVQGKTNRSTSPDSKHFTRKITLPNTVDLSRVVSYLDNGELRVEAPLKRRMYYRNEEILSSGLQPTNIEVSRIQSPISGNHQRHYRRHERVNRHRAASPMRRVRSVESLHHPFYRSSQDFDEDDTRENRHRRAVNYEHYTTNRYDTEEQPFFRSVYSPRSNVVTTRTTYHDYPKEENIYYDY